MILESLTHLLESPSPSGRWVFKPKKKMICRNRQINKNCEEIRLNVSFSVVDVRQSLKRYFALLADSCSTSFALNFGSGEPDLFHYLSRDLFHGYPKDLQQQLCRWAVTLAERHGLIFRGAGDDCFYLSPELGRKAGRPQKDSQDNV